MQQEKNTMIKEFREFISRGNVMDLAVAVIIALAWFMSRTGTGVALRAAGEDPHAVAISGVPVIALRHGAVLFTGLMAALDEGACCHGLVFRIAAENADHETAVIWRREMIAFGYRPAFVPVDTEIGIIEAMTFLVDKSGCRYAGELDIFCQ